MATIGYPGNLLRRRSALHLEGSGNLDLAEQLPEQRQTRIRFLSAIRRMFLCRHPWRDWSAHCDGKLNGGEWEGPPTSSCGGTEPVPSCCATCHDTASRRSLGTLEACGPTLQRLSPHYHQHPERGTYDDWCVPSSEGIAADRCDK